MEYEKNSIKTRNDVILGAALAPPLLVSETHGAENNHVSLRPWSFDMETGKKEERYYSLKIICSLPLAEQLREANALICNEAAKDESVFLESSETRNGHIILLYRLWRWEGSTKGEY